MADIFLSYAREDEPRARLLASALQSRGWSVWWDRRIPPGKDFNAYIEQQLSAAACIIVLWSNTSIASRFVRDEASEGIADGRLVPVLIDAVRQPLGFRQFHTANLTDWRDGQQHADFEALVASIRDVVAPSSGVPPGQAKAAGEPPAFTWPADSTVGASLPRGPVRKAGSLSTVILGIDFGVTRAMASVWQENQPVLITNGEGSRQTPAVVAFTKSGDTLVGQIARRQAVTNPENTISSIKRFIGRTFDEVGEEMKTMPYKVVRAANGDARVDVNGRTFSPQEIAAIILQKVKHDAEQYLGLSVTQAVMTVPAYFNDVQRQATRDAARIAGLEVLRIVNEPTAAALAYGLDKAKDETIAVYDLGGGTFDVSILEIGEGVIEVKATNGDTHLGGDDFDQRVVDWTIGEFKRNERIDLSKDPMALQRLKEAAEKAKIELSATTETEIDLPFITADQTGPKHLRLKLTRTKFEELIDDLLQKTVGPAKQAMADAGVSSSQLDQVVLVGGSTHIPRVKALVKTIFGREPHRGVNPDEAVAVGIAVQAAVLAGDVKDLLLLDVAPLSLGIETLGGVMTLLIPRNSTIPTRKSEIFSTAADNQTSVEVHVLQGERPLARDNRTLGRFHLLGIPLAPRGVPQIEVTFDIDANGIVQVSARDLGTGKEQAIKITGSTGLTRDELDRMVKDAESRAGEDGQRRHEIETRNRAGQTIYEVQRMLRETGDKLDAASRTALEAALRPLTDAIQDSDVEAIIRAQDRLTSAQHKAAEALYKRPR